MAGGRPPSAVVYTVMNFIVDIFTVALCITQMFVGSGYESDELVFHDFSVMDRSVTCLNQFVGAYRATHTEGSEPFGYVCLLGLSLNWYAITYGSSRQELQSLGQDQDHRQCNLSGCRSFLALPWDVIPKNNEWAWHDTVVHSIKIVFISLEAGLLVRNQIKENNGGNKHLLRDLLVVFVETLIAIYRFVDSIGQTHSPWGAEKILHLVGVGLPVLIGACQAGWTVYKAGIRSNLGKWLMKIRPVFAKDEDRAAGAAMQVHGDGGAGKKVAEDGVEVVVTSPS